MAMVRPWVIAGMAALLPINVLAADLPVFEFDSADGGIISSTDWAGKTVLVVNAASRCGFAPQYDALQDLHETHADAGLIVLAIPSDDFQQELDTIDQVKEFCELNFGLTLPMTDITHVIGDNAHPFYQWMRDEHDFEPQWNFNKVLFGPDGDLIGTWGSIVTPDSPEITGAITDALSS